MAGVVDPRDPGIEVGERADGLVFAAIDFRVTRGFRPRRRKRLRRQRDSAAIRFRRSLRPLLVTKGKLADAGRKKIGALCRIIGFTPQ